MVAKLAKDLEHSWSFGVLLATGRNQVWLMSSKPTSGYTEILSIPTENTVLLLYTGIHVLLVCTVKGLCMQPGEQHWGCQPIPHGDA